MLLRILTLAAVMASTSAMHAVTRNIAPQNNSNVAVQNAVNASVSGDIVYLQSGSHYFTGEVVLPSNKSGIVIRGQSGAIVRKASNSNISAFRIDGNGYTFDNIEIDGGLKPGNGVLCYGDSNTFTNCRFHHCGNAGILFHEANNNVVRGGAYNNNNGVGISQWASSGGDIIGQSSSSRLQANQNGLEGLTIDGLSHNCLVQYVTMNSNKGGVGNIGIDQANGSWVYDSTCNSHLNRSGVTFQNNLGPCDGPRIWRCTLNNNNDWPIQVRNVNYGITNYSFANNTQTGNVRGNGVFWGAE